MGQRLLRPAAPDAGHAGGEEGHADEGAQQRPSRNACSDVYSRFKSERIFLNF